jgi:hypothetical protein
MEFGTCYPSGAANFEVAARLLENLCGPRREVDLCYPQYSDGLLGPPTPPSVQDLFPGGGGVKWRGHEAGHLYPSSAGAKNGWSYTSVPHTPL